jgi:hypothetical protein
MDDDMASGCLGGRDHSHSSSLEFVMRLGQTALNLVPHLYGTHYLHLCFGPFAYTENRKRYV